MSDKTKIEWTDATWNPITGCSVVSAGCKHCYAMKLAGTRLQHHPSRSGLTKATSAGPVWTGEVRFNEQWLNQPMRWSRPRMIFVCAHGDLFHENVPDEWIDAVFEVMSCAPQHVFQVLTKRAARMREYVAGLYSRRSVALGNNVPPCRWPLPNVWLGVSAENQAAADERIPLLMTTPAAVRWVSAEPLLGPVDLSRWLDLIQYEDRAPWGRRNIGHLHDMLDWIVVGGESGQHARPMHPDWARALRDQCAAAGVPFLFKQWGEWVPRYWTPVGIYSLNHHPNPEEEVAAGRWAGPCEIRMIRVGKKPAGRLLDGAQHDGYPESGQK